MGTSNSTATIGVTITGRENAVRDLTAISDLVERLNGGGFGHTTTPSLAPASAPRLTNPSYMSPTAASGGFSSSPYSTFSPAGYDPRTGQYSNGISNAGGILWPSQSYSPQLPLPPGALAPKPGGTSPGGSGYGPNWTPPFPGAGGGNGNPISVIVAGAVPLHIANFPANGSGGSGGGNGSGGGQGGSSGSGNSGGGGGNPLANGMPQSSSFLDNFLGHLKQNPTVWGAGEALLKSIPAVPAAVFAGVAATASYALNAYRASTEPAFQTNLNLQAQAASGTWVNPLMASAQRRAADFQGQDGLNRALMSPFDKVLLGIPGEIYDLTAGRDYAQKTALAQAGGQDDLIRQQIAAVTGKPVAMNANVMALQKQREAAAKAARVLTDEGGRYDPYAKQAQDKVDALDRQIKAAKAGVGDASLDTPSLQFLTAGTVFGSGYGLNGAKTFLKKYADDTWTPDQVAQQGATALQYALKPGNADLVQQISAAGGKLPDGLIAAEVRRAIGSGDLSTILGMRKLIGDADAFNAAMSGAMGQFTLATTAIPIASSHVALAGGNLSYDQATGVSYKGQAADSGAAASAIGAQIVLEKQFLKGMTNPADRAAQEAKIRGLEAQQQGALTSKVQLGWQSASTLNQAFSLRAGNAMTGAMMGGSQGDVDSAFGLQYGADMRDYHLDLGKSRSSRLTPEDRAVYAAHAQADRLRARGVQRDRSAYDYGLDIARLGLRDSQAQTQVTHAQLFGDSTSIYTGQMAQNAVLGDVIARDQKRLNDPTSGLDPNARIALQIKINDEMRQFGVNLETAKREFLGLNVSVAEARQGFTAISVGNQMRYLGIGGTAGGGLQGQNVAMAGGTYDAAKANLAMLQAEVDSGKLSPNAKVYIDAKTAVTQAQGGVMGAITAYANLPSTLAVQNQKLDAQFAMNYMSHGFVQFGDMRGALMSSMSAISTGMQDRNKNMTAAMAQIDQQVAAGHLTPEQGRQLKASTQLDFKRQQMGDANDMLSTMGSTHETEKIVR